MTTTAASESETLPARWWTATAPMAGQRVLPPRIEIVWARVHRTNGFRFNLRRVNRADVACGWVSLQLVTPLQVAHRTRRATFLVNTVVSQRIDFGSISATQSTL